MEKKTENTITENDNKENSVDTLKKIEDALAKLEQKEKEVDLKLSELKEQSETISKIEAKLKEIPTRELVEESISTGEALNKEKKVSIVVPKSELNPHDLLVPVTVNGYTYQIIRGEEVEVPVTIKNILKEAKYI